MRAFRSVRAATAALVVVTLIVGSASVAGAAHLFAPTSGFAREGGPIRVQSTTAVRVADIIAPWNKLAGKQLFVVSSDAPQVKFVKDSVTWVSTSTGYLKPYEDCTIHYATTNLYTLRHELGHCLGFVDSVKARDLSPNYINPAVCDVATHALYSPYRGIMSYCNWGSMTTAFGADDRKLLEAAGYAAPLAATPTTAAPVATTAPAPTSTVAPTTSTTAAPSAYSWWTSRLRSTTTTTAKPTTTTTAKPTTTTTVKPATSTSTSSTSTSSTSSTSTWAWSWWSTYRR